MAWKPVFIVLIVFSTFINYFLSLLIDQEKDQRKRKRYFILSLISNFGLLFLFKYSVFINESFMELYKYFGTIVLQAVGKTPLEATDIVQRVLGNYPLKDFDIILPMGISFYTFQAASYTIDVYKRELKPVRHYGYFSLYITFFPQLVAGPIERTANLLPQFYKKHKFNAKRALYGLKIMLLGYFKKIVIADRIAVAVNTVYNQPQDFTGLYFAVASFLFAFQIYCDFSGYSDIAVGCAKILGFDLMKNFKSPYLSGSIREFWRRWHISLSSWLMDYVYIPLGGSRTSKGRHYFNLLATFLVSGLWHGANWTFVIWGGLHGIYQIAGLITRSFRERWKKFWGGDKNPLLMIGSIIVTFLLVDFAWIFFRANRVEDAFYIIQAMAQDFLGWKNRQYMYEVLNGMGLNLYEFAVIGISILILMGSEILSKTEQVYEYWEKKPYLFRLIYYVLIASIVLTAGVYYNAGEFIYFQF